MPARLSARWREWSAVSLCRYLVVIRCSLQAIEDACRHTSSSPFGRARARQLCRVPGRLWVVWATERWRGLGHRVGRDQVCGLHAGARRPELPRPQLGRGSSVVWVRDQYAIARVRVGPEQVSRTAAWRNRRRRDRLRDTHRGRGQDRRVHARARREVVPRSDARAADRAARAGHDHPWRSRRHLLDVRIDDPIARVQARGGRVPLPLTDRPRLDDAGRGARASGLAIGPSAMVGGAQAASPASRRQPSAACRARRRAPVIGPRTAGGSSDPRRPGSRATRPDRKSPERGSSDPRGPRHNSSDGRPTPDTP
jgi:hypothetical protein